MKRGLLLLLALCLFAYPVMAGAVLTYDCQNANTFPPLYGISYITGGTGDVTPSVGSDAYNNFYLSYSTSGTAKRSAYVIDAPQASTYWAATMVAKTTGAFNTASPLFAWYDAGGNLLGYYNVGDVSTTNVRYEFKLFGGQIHAYRDSVEINPNVLATGILPTYFGIGSPLSDTGFTSVIGWDDIVIAQDYTGSHQVLDSPPSTWYITHDFITNLTKLYDNTGAVYDAQYVRVRYAKDDTSSLGIQFKNPVGTTIQEQFVTGMAGTATFDMSNMFSTNYISGTGTYYARDIHYWVYNGTPTPQAQIPVYSGGATISFDKPTYALGETAVVTYHVLSGYWNRSAYNYRIVVQDLYGNEISSEALTVDASYVLSQIPSTGSIGVYYALLYITPIGTTNDILANAASCEVNGYVLTMGYVMNAETGAVLSDALVNVTQTGGDVYNGTSLASGEWNVSVNMQTGSKIYINTSKTGYTSDSINFTPLTAGTKVVNISLLSTTPSYTGVAIGGIVRDNLYRNPVTGATVNVRNGTTYQNITNIAGYYRVDNLVANTLYDVWSTKTGFGNSTVAQKLAVGV